jgi:hypothetical protein
VVVGLTRLLNLYDVSIMISFSVMRWRVRLGWDCRSPETPDI